MNFNKNIDKILLLIPAIVILFIALIPTLKYQWPLSWDIIMHVQYAKVYAQYGLVLNNPLLNAPAGQKIGYPPLFHLLLVFFGAILKIDYFQIARILQPILAFSVVLSVSYVAKEFYGKIAGISAGFLIISSNLIHRIILPIPENLALILLPFAVYFYYKSIKEETLKYALISGFMLIIMLFMHLAAPQILFLIVTAFTILALILCKKLNVLKNYGAFLAGLIILVIAGLIALIIFKPDLLNGLLQQGLTAVTGYSTSINNNRPLNISIYLRYIGAITLIFASIGVIFALKKMQKKNLFIFVWILTTFLLSNAYWFGINVITYRVLIYLLLPLAIIGGFGLSQIYYKFKEYKVFSSKKFRSGFLISIFILSSISGILTVENPKIANFGTNTEFGYVQIAPPSDSEVDLANWFNENGNKDKSILISNLYTGIFIATESGMPIHNGFGYYDKITPQTTYRDEKIGYVVIDKRLIFQSKEESSYVKPVDTDFHPLYYISNDVVTNLNLLIPDFVKKVYENKDFIIFKVDNP